MSCYGKKGLQPEASAFTGNARYLQVSRHPSNSGASNYALICWSVDGGGGTSVLKRGKENAAPVLPIRNRTKLYVENVDPVVAEEYGDVVERVEEADLAILRLSTP